MAQQTAILEPGQIVVLPGNAVINTIILDGDTTLSSSCGTLPTAEVYACYDLQWSLQRIEGGTNILESDSATFGSIWIGGIEYPIGGGLAYGSEIDIYNLLITAAPTAIFNVVSTKKNDFADIYTFYLRFKTAPSLVSSIEMSLIGNGFTEVFIKPTAAGDCDCLTDEGADSNVHCPGA